MPRLGWAMPPPAKVAMFSGAPYEIQRRPEVMTGGNCRPVKVLRVMEYIDTFCPPTTGIMAPAAFR